jgi:WD40 repeat protein
VSSVAVSPSGQLCAAISSDGWLRVGRLGESGVLEPLFSHQRSGLLIARFLDEERLLLGDMRGELALLDLVSWREVYRRQLDYDPIDSLAVGPERRRVAVALRSSRIQILDAGRRLISAGSDAQVLVWNLEGGLQKGESGRSPP